ncbi:MAG TPA: hypothetical protein PLS50_09420, partial [Candidatus Dojkabacteria bacterium]|nr:hypothetical protein [Candidatus Dojkabacteria bacterium]
MANNNETIKYTTKAQFEISFGVPIPSSGGNDLLGIILSPLEDLYKEALRYFILREIEKAKIDISQIPNYPKDADYFLPGVSVHRAAALPAPAEARQHLGSI